MTERCAFARCRGLSLLELLLALTVTAMIAGAIYGMMGAVMTGVSSRRDNRTTMVGAHAASTRLSAYLAPCRSILDAEPDALTIWLHDHRESSSVHASEIRWMQLNEDEGTLEVLFVSFPPEWSDTAKNLADLEYPSGSDWSAVLTTYQLRGHVAAMPIVDGLEDLVIETDEAAPEDSRHAVFLMSLLTTGGSVDITVSATIRLHQPPAS